MIYSFVIFRIFIEDTGSSIWFGKQNSWNYVLTLEENSKRDNHSKSQKVCDTINIKKQEENKEMLSTTIDSLNQGAPDEKYNVNIKDIMKFSRINTKSKVLLLLGILQMLVEILQISRIS